MRDLNYWMCHKDTHVGKSMMILVVIAHGDYEEMLYTAERKRGWNVQQVVDDLCSIEALYGKPKILFLDACRGSKCRESYKYRHLERDSLRLILKRQFLIGQNLVSTPFSMVFLMFGVDCILASIISMPSFSAIELHIRNDSWISVMERSIHV